MTITGVAFSLDTIFALHPDNAWSGIPMPYITVGFALLTLAVGVRIGRTPHWCIRWIASTARLLRWRDIAQIPSIDLATDGRQAAGGSSMAVLLTTYRVDRRLYRTVFSVVALTAGVLLAVLPFSIYAARSAYVWMDSRFLWPGTSRMVLQSLIGFAAGAIPLSALGLTVSGAHRFGEDSSRWEPRATAWLLLGAAAGVLITQRLQPSVALPNTLLPAAALPMLVTVLIAALAGGSGGDASTGCTGTAETDPAEPRTELPAVGPELRREWPILLRGAAVLLAASGAGILALWFHGKPNHIVNGTSIPLMLAAAGTGGLAGCRIRRGTVRSIGGVGATCAMTGVLLAAATIPAAQGADPARVPPAGMLGIGFVSLGFSFVYGWQALLNRVADPSFAGTTTLIRVLSGAGVMVWLAVPLAHLLAGTRAAMVGLALIPLILGGTLIIHEPRYSPRTRRARLCTVFASIAGMILLAWLTPRWWSPRRADPVGLPTGRGPRLSLPPADRRIELNDMVDAHSTPPEASRDFRRGTAAHLSQGVD